MWGFEKIINSIGGVEICVNETQREGYSFELQKGCNTLNGEIALNWIVSRKTEVLVGEKLLDENGEDISSWKPMPGVSDLTRIEKQQQLVVSMMKNINNFESFNSFLNFVNALENAFTIDQNISIIEASNLLWEFRELNFEKVKKITVPTFNYVTSSGAQVLVLDQNLDGIIATNTTISRKNLNTSSFKLNKIGNGGLSGLPLTHKSTEVIRYIAKKTNQKIPIIGVGGIMNENDALEKLDAGASLLQIYTGFIYHGPSLIKNINKKILSSA